MTCAKCGRELEPEEKAIFGWLVPDCFCEPCWKELTKDTPPHPDYVEADE